MIKTRNGERGKFVSCDSNIRLPIKQKCPESQSTPSADIVSDGLSGRPKLAQRDTTLKRKDGGAEFDCPANLSRMAVRRDIPDGLKEGRKKEDLNAVYIVITLFCGKYTNVFTIEDNRGVIIAVTGSVAR